MCLFDEIIIIDAGCHTTLVYFTIPEIQYKTNDQWSKELRDEEVKGINNKIKILST